MRSLNQPDPPAALRAMLISDDRGDLSRFEGIVSAALRGGIRTVQLREHSLSARALERWCLRLRPVLDACDGLLLVNDRSDLVVANLAHGVHLGARSMSPDRVRRMLPGAIVGCAAHDAAQLEAAAQAGADYATLSPVYPTSCKPGADVLGTARAVELTARARVPVLWLGGIDVDRVRSIPAHGPFGVALRSGLCDADDVAGDAAELIRAWRDRAP